MMSNRTSETPVRYRGWLPSETGDLAAFAGRDGVFGRAAGARTARLDFDERQHAGAPRDDVDLAATDTLVDGDDAVGLLLEVHRRQALGRPAEFVRVCRHEGLPSCRTPRRVVDARMGTLTTLARRRSAMKGRDKGRR